MHIEMFVWHDVASGAMGRRTKFQTEDKAQLVLKVTRPGRFPEESSTATANEVSAVKLIELPKVHILHFLSTFYFLYFLLFVYGKEFI